MRKFIRLLIPILSLHAIRKFFAVLCLFCIAFTVSASLSGCARQIVGLDRLGPPWNAHTREIADDLPEDSLAALPLPSEDKVLSFDDCIFTAAQHAPDMIESLIGLELWQIASESAYSKRFPSFNAFFRVIANTTRKHKQYEDASFRFGLTVAGFEPVLSYFTHEASLIMEKIALLTHKIAMEKKAAMIGEAMLSLQNKKKLLDMQQKRLEQARYFQSYLKAKGHDSLDPMELAKAEHNEKRIIAEIEKTEASIDSLLLAIKIQTGLEPGRTLRIEPAGLNAMLASDGAAGALEKASRASVWQHSPEAEIYKLALDLHDYDILASWTGYLPGMAWDIYTANPKSDYATYSGDEDIFLGINFTIPLLDWGERQRAVQGSRLEKLRESKRADAARTGFAARWQEALHNYKSAVAAYEAVRNKVAAIALNERRAVLQHKNGQVDFPVVEKIRTDLYDEEIILLERERQVKLSEFAAWMLSGNFRWRYFE
jgi:hypothetical protein